MNWKFILRKKKSLTPREAANKRKLYVFVLCVLCSALFWLFIKLSQDNQAPFSKNIIFNNFPEGTTGVNQSDSTVSFVLETSGLRLITESYFSPEDTLFFDVDQLSAVSKDGHKAFYLTREELHHQLSTSYGDWASVTLVEPDTVKVEAVKAITRKLPVYLDANINYEKRFNLYGEKTVQPDSITVTGPKSILDTMDVVKTRFLEKENVRATFRKDVDLNIPSKLLTADVRSVMVHVPVEEFTEATISLPIVIECPDPAALEQLRLFPQKVDLSYVVALRDYRMVNENMFQVSVTCPQAELNASDRLHVHLDKYPAFVEVLNIRPSRVDYVILE